MKMFKDSKAVSPVIGVMLMLVVTVILAAAVSSTSSGLMKSSDAAPTAVFTVEIFNGSTGDMPLTAHMMITEVTGDTIPTKDLKIVTINPNAAGENKTMEVVPGAINCRRVSDTSGTTSYGVMPYKNDGVTYFGTNSEAGRAKNFGNYTIKPGVIMIADNYGYNNAYYTAPLWDSDTGDYVGDDNARTGMQAMFADWASVSAGDFVTVKIIHTPTQKVIFQSEVEVQ